MAADNLHPIARRSLIHLEDAATALLSGLSRFLVADGDDESSALDSLTPMAAALRSISVVVGLLESLDLTPPSLAPAGDVSPTTARA